MSYEKKDNPSNEVAEMLVIWQQIQILGRNDVELSAGPQIIKLVTAGEITPAEGKRRMQSLLNSKQEH